MTETIPQTPDIVAAAQLIAEEHRQLHCESRVLDPSGGGKCWKKTCRACGAESLGRRITFEEFSECHACGSADTRIRKARYPRHTEATLRVHIAREFGDTHRDLYTSAQRYLRQHRPAPRERLRARSCGSRRHRSAKPTATPSRGDPDPDPDPEGSARCAPILVMVERRADHERRAALIDLLAELLPGGAR